MNITQTTQAASEGDRMLARRYFENVDGQTHAAASRRVAGLSDAEIVEAADLQRAIAALILRHMR